LEFGRERRDDLQFGRLVILVVFQFVELVELLIVVLVLGRGRIGRRGRGQRELVAGSGL
jgi:hypothetical protein